MESGLKIEILTIDEAKDIFVQSLKGSFYNNPLMRNHYTIKGTITGNINKHSFGTNFKIVSESGNSIGIFLSKNIDTSELESGLEVGLFGMFNLYENKLNDLDMLQFKASRIKILSHKEDKKAQVLEIIKSRGYLEKPKKRISFAVENDFKIAVITSKTSEAIKDIRNNLRNPFFTVTEHYVDLYNPTDIANMITSVDNHRAYDVIMLARGGVNKTEVFDSIEILEAIYNAKTFILSAIGHASQNPLSNLVADASKDTPSSGAEYIVSKYRDYNLTHTMKEKDDYIKKLAENLDTLNKINAEQVKAIEKMTREKADIKISQNIEQELIKLRKKSQTSLALLGISFIVIAILLLL